MGSQGRCQQHTISARSDSACIIRPHYRLLLRHKNACYALDTPVRRHQSSHTKDTEQSLRPVAAMSWPDELHLCCPQPNPAGGARLQSIDRAGLPLVQAETRRVSSSEKRDEVARRGSEIRARTSRSAVVSMHGVAPNAKANCQAAFRDNSGPSHRAVRGAADDSERVLKRRCRVSSPLDDVRSSERITSALLFPFASNDTWSCRFSAHPRSSSEVASKVMSW